MRVAPTDQVFFWHDVSWKEERREKRLSAGYRRTEIEVVEERRVADAVHVSTYYLLQPVMNSSTVMKKKTNSKTM